MNHLMRLSFLLFCCFFLSCTQKQGEEKSPLEEDLARVEEEEEWNPLCSLEGDPLPDPQETVPSEMLSVPTIP